MIGLVNTVYVRSCLSLVNSFNSLSLVKHRRISSLSHPKHTLLSVRIRKMNTSLSKRKTVRKYGQIQTSGEYLFTDTEVNYQRHKKILSIKTQLERLNTCLVVHFVLQTSQYHRISRAWVANQGAWNGYSLVWYILKQDTHAVKIRLWFNLFSWWSPLRFCHNCFPSFQVISVEFFRTLALAMAAVFLATIIVLANLWTCLMVFVCVSFTLVRSMLR